MSTAAELTLGRDVDAVPKARRFVVSSLTGEAPALIHAVGLAVTELVTNALLHGEPPVSVRLVHLGNRVRVEIEDHGHTLPVPGLQDGESMTGRGLALVAALSSRWGIQPGRRPGKVVWAEVGTDLQAVPDGDAHPANLPEIDPESAVAARLSHYEEPTYTVRFDGVPVDLLLAAKAQIDNVVRELILVQAAERARGSDLAPGVVTLVETVTGEFAEPRAELKRQALAAAARGDPVVDLELHLPLYYADVAERYLAALEEADRYARSARLLTLAPPLSHRTFRRWYLRALIEQLRELGAGRVPRPPVPFTDPVEASGGEEVEASGGEEREGVGP